jgi:hypothetical protein
MEFTFTFAEIIDKMIDLALLGMESFVAVWMFAAFASNVYSDSDNLPTAMVVKVPTQEPTVAEPAIDIEAVINELTYKSLRKVLRELQIKYSGLNKESMITTLLSKIEEEKIDINLLLTA